jgi:uncharacterized protein YjdB
MLATLLLPLLAAISCGYSSSGSYTMSPPDPVAVSGVKLTPQSVVLTAIGATKQLVLDVTPANATDKAVTWESSNPAVATVSATGLVTAKAAGNGVFVTVVTHDGNFQASVNVSVEP